MEVVGSASAVAGLCSLGIEVCQGLLTYYQSWKNAEQDVARMYNAIEALERSLVLVQHILQGDDIKYSHRENVEKRVLAAQQGILRLQKRLGKIKLVPKNISWGERTKAQFRRTLYPFKESTLMKLKELGQETRDELNLALSVLQTDLSVATSVKMNAVSRQLDGVVESVDGVRDDVETMLSFESNEYLLRLSDWLSPLAGEFEKKQSDTFHLQARQDRIGRWLQNDDRFRAWLKGAGTLWCTGIPGAGKTVLTSIIIDNLHHQIAKERDVGLAYIYCSYKEREKQNALDLVASIVQQLLIRQKGLLLSEVGPIYENLRVTKSRPTMTEYSGLLEVAMMQYSKVYIVVDALDECSEKGQNRKTLVETLQKVQPKLCLLVTSRDIPSIRQQLGAVKNIEIRAGDEDIESYIEERILSSERLAMYAEKDTTLKDTIKTFVLGKASGMFLLARLHLDSLSTKPTIRKLKNALSTLPEGFDESYDEVMSRIRAQGTEEYLLAKQMLYWIAYAMAPLTLPMLQHALAIEGLEDTCIDQDNIPAAELLVSVCAGMVVLQPESMTVELVHYTAQDYLDRKGPELFPGAYEQIFKACITYLSFDEFAAGPCDDGRQLQNRLQSYPLLSYVARYWGEYALMSGCEQKYQSPILDLIHREPSMKAMAQVTIHFQVSAIQIPRVFDMDPLHIASYLKLKRTVALLLEDGASMASDSFGVTAIHSAGHQDITTLLLHHGANVNLQDNNGRTPLMHNAWRGNEAVMKVLLDSGADTALANNAGDTALHEAIRNEQQGAAILLLSSGADLNSKNVVNAVTGLYLAARFGDIQLVELFLAHKADPWIFSHAGESPACAAALRGHDIITCILIRAMSESSQKDCASIAAKQGILVRALIGGSSAIDIVDGQGRSALMLASRGTLVYIDKLLSLGSNPHLVDKQGRSALHHSAAKGSIKSIERLLKEGLDPNSADADGWTPLHWAAHIGKPMNVKALLEAGADRKAKSVDGWTPLTVAIYHDRKSLIEILNSFGDSLEAAEMSEMRQTLAEWIINRRPWAPSTTAEQKMAQDYGRNVSNYFCDGCDLEICGPRYKCLICSDFDYCFKCVATAEVAHEHHEFIYTHSLSSRASAF